MEIIQSGKCIQRDDLISILSFYWQKIIKGIIIVAAVLIDVKRKRSKA